MKILDGDKEAYKYQIKQAVKYIFLSAFFGIGFFFLGMLIYKINSEEGNISTSEVEMERMSIGEENNQQIVPEAINSEVQKTEKIAEPEPYQEALSQTSLQEEVLAEESSTNTSSVIDGTRLFYQKLAELEQQAPLKENKAKIEELPQEELDKIYEEELPNNVIVENWEEPELTPKQIAEGYHIYQRHTDVKQLNIRPAYKPAYFGTEPVIAVVIDDMGIAKKRTADIISLSAPLTAAFLSYGTDLDAQVAAAKEAGMEIMLHAPMEPYSKVDIAPDVLSTHMSPEEVQKRLKDMLSKFPGIKGINNHMGSKFTEDKERMQAVMEVLRKEGLFFLDSKTTAKSVGKETAQEQGVSYASRNVFIDNENKVEYIQKQLGIAEKIARRNGYAIAIGHPKSGTYEALKQWLKSLPEKKIKILPLSEIVKVLHQSHI